MTRLLSALLLACALPALPAFAADHIVTISGMRYSPGSLSVKVGDSVTFRNADAMPHTATAAAFNTGTIAPGKSKKVTIKAAGGHTYVCKFHPSMKGQVAAK